MVETKYTKEWTKDHIIAEQPFVTLNNGIKMPSIGLGTYDS